MKRTAALVAIVLAAALSACTSDEPAVGEARLVPEGVVQVSEPGGPWQTVSSARRLAAGDRVRVRRGGAVLELAGGGRLELRRGSTVEVARRPVLESGDLLVDVGQRPIVVDAEGTVVGVERGAARLSRSLALTAAAYTGTAELEGAGRSLRVPALRQAVVPAEGFLPNIPSPLRYDEGDEWDRRFLGPAIELGRELQAKSLGFTSQLQPGQGATPTFFRTVLPVLGGQPGFDVPLLDAARPPGETLVGAAIAAASDRGTFGQRWQAVFEFRDAGAEWGLVALDQGVERDPLVAELDAAIGRAAPQLVFAAPTTAPVLPTGPPPPGTGGPPPPTTRPPATAPPPTEPPGPPPNTTTTTTIIDPGTIVPTLPSTTLPTDPVRQLVDEVLGSLAGP